MRPFRVLSAIAALGAIAASAPAIVFNQPWQPNNSSSFESVVQLCSNPIPMPVITFDDFGFSVSGHIHHITWWGTLTTPLQPSFPFHFEIYNDLGGQPDIYSGPIWSDCDVPMYAAAVGSDCPGLTVYKMRVHLSTPFHAVAGHVYWLSIQENLFNSASTTPDFGWSGTYNYHGARACQYNISTGVITQPLPDNCGALADMSFRLF